MRAPGYGYENHAYPDGLVVCGEERYDDHYPPSLRNPSLLIEVTSASTRARDFDDKFGAYFRIDTLLEYWINDPDRIYVHQYIRSGEGILIKVIVEPGDSLSSGAFPLQVPLKEVYRRIDV